MFSVWAIFLIYLMHPQCIKNVNVHFFNYHWYNQNSWKRKLISVWTVCMDFSSWSILHFRMNIGWNNVTTTSDIIKTLKNKNWSLYSILCSILYSIMCLFFLIYLTFLYRHWVKNVNVTTTYVIIKTLKNENSLYKQYSWSTLHFCIHIGWKNLNVKCLNYLWYNQNP